jgi:hypothetical protein
VTHRDERFSSSNPFSTRYVRPGAIPYQFLAGQCAADLVAKLAALRWRGQIIGPHGSGKSTLIAKLIEPLERQGRPAWMICLRDGQRRPPSDWTRQAQRAGARLILVDGYEQLGFWSRFWLKARCRQRHWGLLVTAHRDVGLPTLFETMTSVQTAQAVVEHLLPPRDAIITGQMVAESLAASQGNMREMLFLLYDYYEKASESG